MIKVMHTADWHLGKRLEMSERTEEHKFFLEWLLQKINEEKVDVLVVAGDIFDNGSPSNTSLAQYYGFLTDIQSTCCKNVIIVGGNHDSVSTLNAPKELLKRLKVHVIGGVPECTEDQIFSIVNKDGLTELIVCAVPFLRDKDIRLSIAGETVEEIEERLIEGICGHYEKFIEPVKTFKENGVPIIATGHLFAQGAITSDSENMIHVGNLAQIAADKFPAVFNYVALGHLHRPQMVGGVEHIRYSGSPIPLSFSESGHDKVVTILTFEEGELAKIEDHKIPTWRRLFRVHGNMKEVKQQLDMIQDPKLELPCWVEVQIRTQSMIFDAADQLEEIKLKKDFIERILIRQIRERQDNTDETHEEMTELFELSPKAVFKKRCEQEESSEDMGELEQMFDLTMELMSEKDGSQAMIFQA